MKGDNPMTVPAPEIEALAEDLLRARDSRTTLDPPTKRIDSFTLADGYAVGAAIAARRTGAGGRRIAGQKIGLTYRAIWDRIGLEHPVWAPVYDDGIHEGADKVSVAGLVAPKVEVEVVLGFERPVPVGAGREQIAAAVGWAALGYEIVDCHYPGWALTPPDMVADFGCHAGLVIAPRRSITAEDVLALSGLEITLRCDGEDVATGGGADVLGGPVDAVHAVLASPQAMPVRAGDVITTGALTRGAHASAAGNCWTAQAHAGPSFDPVRVRLT
jgi:2-oxo-3-hexenedioate decarboxylase